eukprot:gene6072-4185_t
MAGGATIDLGELLSTCVDVARHAGAVIRAVRASGA